MLLNRRRINRWAKVSAATLAFIFAFTFVTMGVGSGLNVNFLDLWRGIGNSSGSSSASATSPQDQLDQYEKTLAGDATNYDALLGAANAAGSLGQVDQEIVYLERAVKVRESADLYKRLATLYTQASDNEGAVRVLNQATALNTNDADSFLQLGAAQRNLGNSSAAILAWNRYLELAPTGDMAATVQQQIDALSGSTETSATAGATETTDPAATTTTAK